MFKMEKEIISDKQDSIKVNKGMNGKYSFEIKRYYNFDKTIPADVIKQIVDIEERLQKEFKEG